MDVHTWLIVLISIGTFSGFLYLDPQGTVTGSTFTMTLSDNNPKFFMAIRVDLVGNCSALADWSHKWNLGSSGDIMFALNPVYTTTNEANFMKTVDQSLANFKAAATKQLNVPVTFGYRATGGQLYMKTSDPQANPGKIEGSSKGRCKP